MTVLVRLDGEVVATVGRSRAYLSPAAEALPDGDPKLQVITLMCDYALTLGEASSYRDADALRHARNVMKSLPPSGPHICDSPGVADRTCFSLRPVHGAKPMSEDTAQRIGGIARADFVELRETGETLFCFDRAHDSETVRGHLEMASRIELGAHWHTRYELAVS
jgi:hypothetical protein